ncbi:MAG TPA: hypothetical protein PK993_00710 [Clostridia bacterium]|nr:hypothetical protein [Clostridia bacterium]
MNYRAKIQLKIRDFYQKYKLIIFIVLIIWTCIFVINRFLGNQNNNLLTPKTTYDPHVSVMNTNKEVPEKLQQPIQTIIDTYFNHCNNGEFQKAYDLISEECKSNYFTSYKLFENYAKEIFGNTKKIYNIQSYSNLDNTYIYKIKILEDILANGTTTGYGYYEEKITIKGDDSNNLKINIGNFVSKENINIFAEDEYLKIEVLGKTVKYDSEIYNVKFTNKSEYPIVLANNKEEFEIGIYIGDQTRAINLPIGNITLSPNSTQIRNLEFTKFVDDGKKSDVLIFNAIRVLQSYSGESSKYEQEINNAIKLYSLTLNM